MSSSLIVFDSLFVIEKPSEFYLAPSFLWKAYFLILDLLLAYENPSENYLTDFLSMKSPVTTISLTSCLWKAQWQRAHSLLVSEMPSDNHRMHFFFYDKPSDNYLTYPSYLWNQINNCFLPKSAVLATKGTSGAEKAILVCLLPSVSARVYSIFGSENVP